MPSRRRVTGMSASERGSVTILVAVLLAALMGFGGIALDLGNVTSNHRRAQNAADGAAQAAGYEIYAGATESTATSMADTIVAQHGLPSADLTGLQYLDSMHAPTSNPSSVAYIQSTVTWTFPTYLMGVLGIHTATVVGSATVTVGSGGGNCAFCVLSHTQGDVTSGSQTINVTNGGIWINDANSGAVTGSGSTTMNASNIDIAASGSGAITTSGSSSFTPSATLGAGFIQDPLANVPAPSVSINGSVASGNCSLSGTQLIISGSGVTCTINPGIYSSIIMSGSGTLTFNPGVYVFTGGITISGTWAFKDNTSSSPYGVMLYLTCSGYSSTSTAPCNGSSGAGLTWSGTTTYQLTAPTTGPYKGLTIFYDRKNTAGITLSGSPSDNFTGTLYAADSAGTMSGSFPVNQFNSRVILSNLTTSGTTSVNLNFNQSQNYLAASLPVFSQ